MAKKLTLRTTRTATVEEEHVLAVPDDFDSDRYADLTFEELAATFPITSATELTARYGPLAGGPEGVTREITFSTVTEEG
jgi:hypothetical protein